MRFTLLSSGAACAALLSGSASAQATVQHYWNFTTNADLVGGVATTAVGTPVTAVNATYGEAYAGSGPSLNTAFGGGGYLEADVFDGVNATALDYGSGDFSVSYWSYDEDDGDARGPRVFDCLDGTSTGFQQGTNLSPPSHNFRIDDDGGAVVLSESAGVIQPVDQWTHIAILVNRGSDTLDVFFNGTSAYSVDISSLTGDVFPTQDLQIGVINNGASSNVAQACGLDDLAFYSGLLSASEIAGLAAGSLSPASIQGGGVGTNYCGPAVSNSTGASGTIIASGSNVAAQNNLSLQAIGLPNNQFGYFINSMTQGLIPNPGGSQGNICLSGGIGRYNGPGQVLSTGSTGSISLVLDLANTPTPLGPASVMTGETWNFQCWYRDANPMATSNFTDGTSVAFQ